MGSIQKQHRYKQKLQISKNSKKEEQAKPSKNILSLIPTWSLWWNRQEKILIWIGIPEVRFCNKQYNAAEHLNNNVYNYKPKYVQNPYEYLVCMCVCVCVFSQYKIKHIKEKICVFPHQKCPQWS